MNYLDTILSNSEIDKLTLALIRKNYLLVESQLVKHQIVFGEENAELVFTNHIVSLIKRILTKEFVDEIEESLMREISEEAMGLALALVEDIFSSNGLVPNRSEVFLVATHMQLYLNSIKEEISHG